MFSSVSLQAFFSLRQQRGQPCLHLDCPTRRSAIAFSNSSSNRTHLPLPQPPATPCLNNLPAFPPLFLQTVTLSKAKKKKRKKNQPHFLHNLCQKEKTRKLYRMTQTETQITWSTLSQVFSHQISSIVLHSQTYFREKKNPNKKPVYAKEVCMHNLWIIYFCINVQLKGDQMRR